MSSNADDTTTTNGVAPEELPADTASEATTPQDDEPADSGPAAEAAADRAAAVAVQAAPPPAAAAEAAQAAPPAAAAAAGPADELAAEPEGRGAPDQQEAQEAAVPAEPGEEDAPFDPDSEEDAPFDPDSEEDAPDEPDTDNESEHTKVRQVASAAKEEDFVEDGRADQALDFVVDVLTTMGMDCTVDLMENDENDPPSDIRIEITGKDADRLIGKKGQTLAAMQFLTNRVVNRPSKPRRHILIDADGYRARREHALSAMAQRLGKQAVEEGKIITFEPMTAQDRRVVHLALVKLPGVVTKSEGKGSTRRVQIIPVREQEQGSERRKPA